MDRHAIFVSPSKIDRAIKNIKKYDGSVVSVSCSNNDYLVIYKSEEEIDKELILDR